MTCIWKKMSIFFDLPYWSDLDVRHCIDVMHVEKNVCDRVSQRALRGRAKARLTGVLSKGGKMRGVATNVYLWKMSEKPKETGQNENSKFGSYIYV